MMTSLIPDSSTGQVSTKGKNQIKGLFPSSFPLPVCGAWGFPPKAPSCAEKSFLLKLAVLVRLVTVPREGALSPLSSGAAWQAGDVSQGSRVTAEPAREDLALLGEIPWDES